VAVRFRIRRERSSDALGEKRRLQSGRVGEDAFEEFFDGLSGEERVAWRQQAMETGKARNPDSEEGDWWLEAMVEQQMRQRYEERVT
jgi:hypothetical protein